MGLVPEPLEQHQGFPGLGGVQGIGSARHIDLVILLSPVPVRLGQARHREPVFQPQLPEYGHGHGELAPASVHHQEIRITVPGLRSQETPGQHLGHAGVVVLAVRFVKNIMAVPGLVRHSPGKYHHGGHRVGAGQIGVVEAFDAPRIGGHAKQLLEHQQGLPGLCLLGQALLQFPCRIEAGHIQDLPFLPPDRCQDGDFPPLFTGQLLHEGRPFLGSLGHQDFAGNEHGPGVELLDKGLQDLCEVRDGRVKGEMAGAGQVACPDEQDGDHGLVPVLGAGDHVPVLQVRGHGHLLLQGPLNGGHGVPDLGRLFKGFLLRLPEHLLLEAADQLRSPPLEEQDHVPDDGVVHLPGNRVAAGPQAGVDLEIEAGAGPVPELAFPAFAEFEDPVYAFQGGTHAVGRRVGAEIGCPVGAHAPDDLQAGIVPGHVDAHARVVLAVLEDDVVPWRVALDQGGFQEQGLLLR